MRSERKSFFLSLFLMFAIVLPSTAQNVPGGPVTTNQQAIDSLDLTAPGMEKVAAAVQTGNLQTIQSAYLDYRRTASTAQFTVKPSDQPVRGVSGTDPIGDEISRHYIRNFFHDFKPTGADMGADFNWTYNPVPRSDPSYTDEWTWSAISRTQFWNKLAEAYWKTRNEKYAREWVDQLEDFTRKNPMNHDSKPPLWRPLDASIRMSDSWPYAYYHFLNSPSFTPEANWIFLRMTQDHAALLTQALSDTKLTGNIVASESFGLFTIGTLFPELKDAATWRQTGLDRLTRELERAVPPDGFEAELTPSYHMVALDGFLGTLKLAQLNNLPIPSEFHDKILSMYRAVVIVMAQNGEVVPTNDSTPVNAFKTSRGGMKVMNDPLLQWAATAADTGQLQGPPPLPNSTMLPYAGFYAMRSGWKPDDLFLFFRGGPAGIGHEHEDMLEVTMRAWGKTLLFDPGTYVYDHSDWRRFFIGTSAHSSIIVDGKGQHRGPSSGTFTPVTNPWVSSPLFDFVAATFNGGYQSNVLGGGFQAQQWVGPLDSSVSHTRRVIYLRPYYALVIDTLDGSGNHTFDAHFQLDAPSAQVDSRTLAAFSDNPGGAQLALFPLERDRLQTEVVQGQQTPLLGWKPANHTPIPTVRFRKQQNAPAIFATFLYPYNGQTPDFRSKPLPIDSAGAWSQSLETPREKAEIVLMKDGTSAALSFRSDLVGKIDAKAAGVLVREPAGGNHAFVGAWGLLSFTSENLQFSASQSGAVVIAIHERHPVFFNPGSAPLVVTLTRPVAQTVTLAPGVWTEVGSGGARNVAAPDMFAPFVP
ncbi:MAG TPA: alginate lyase family protein [Candidatus Acidoferrales bacterium]